MALIRIGLFGVLTLLLSACGGRGTTIDNGGFDLRQLEGRWEFVNDRTNQIEEWAYVGEDELRGRGYVLEDGDTTFIEFLSIHRQDGVLTYYARVTDVATSEVIPFTLSYESSRKIEFINSKQEFPKKIGYEVISESAIQSYIEGPRDGQNIRVLFDFLKK